nr:hypothetical protein [Mangrovicoccus ximenensis]
MGFQVGGPDRTSGNSAERRTEDGWPWQPPGPERSCPLPPEPCPPVRICAEDAAADFRPAIGEVLLVEEPQGAGVRVDSGILEGDTWLPGWSMAVWPARSRNSGGHGCAGCFFLSMEGCPLIQERALLHRLRQEGVVSRARLAHRADLRVLGIGRDHQDAPAVPRLPRSRRPASGPPGRQPVIRAGVPAKLVCQERPSPAVPRLPRSRRTASGPSGRQPVIRAAVPAKLVCQERPLDNSWIWYMGCSLLIFDLIGVN